MENKHVEEQIQDNLKPEISVEVSKPEEQKPKQEQPQVLKHEIKQQETIVIDIIREADELRAKWDYEEALKLYSKASELNPFNARPYYKMGIVHYLQNNLDAAEKDWQKGWKAEWQK